MKILWLSSFLPFPPRGGALQRSYNLFEFVAGRHDVSLISLNNPRLLPPGPGLREAATALGRLARVRWFPNPAERSRLRRLGTMAGAVCSPRSYAERWMACRPMAAELERQVGEWVPDVIHVDTLGLAPYLTRAEGVPAILNHHNVESHMASRRRRNQRNPLARLYLEWEARKLAGLERTWVPRVANNLVVSDLDADRLDQIVPGARTHIVENGVDLDFFKPATAPAAQRGLVFAGRWGWYPNRQAADFFLASIWPRLVADSPTRTMTFVGKEPYKGLYVAAERDFRIHVTGAVDDVRPYLDQAAIYVCPILDGGGTRLKILDALAMAKPLVATAMAVEGLGMEDGRHYLRAETPEDYVRQVTRLEADVGLRERLAEQGRRHVEARFGWASIGRRLEAAYAGAIGDATPSPDPPRRAP